jgi:hypothetical protein
VVSTVVVQQVQLRVERPVDQSAVGQVVGVVSVQKTEKQQQRAVPKQNLTGLQCAEHQARGGGGHAPEAAAADAFLAHSLLHRFSTCIGDTSAVQLAAAVKMSASCAATMRRRRRSSSSSSSSAPVELCC